VILNGLEERRRYVILLFDKLEYCLLWYPRSYMEQKKTEKFRCFWRFFIHENFCLCFLVSFVKPRNNQNKLCTF
jgi:hypothetical protein